MRISRVVLIFLFLLLASLPDPRQVTAAEKKFDLESFLAIVEQQAAKVDSFSTRFKQVKYLAIFPAPVEFTGRLILVRPDRLRWEFREPLPSTLVLNGKNGLKCSGKSPVRKFSLDTDPVMRMVADQLWAWTSGSYQKLDDTFVLELLPGPALSLKPLQNGSVSFVEEIKVAFDPEIFQPVKIEIIEAGSEDRTLIHFSDYQRNIEVEDRLFTECMIK